MLSRVVGSLILIHVRFPLLVHFDFLAASLPQSSMIIVVRVACRKSELNKAQYIPINSRFLLALNHV